MTTEPIEVKDPTEGSLSLPAEDPGFFTLDLFNKKLRLDLFEEHNALLDLYESTGKKDGPEYHKAIAARLAGLLKTENQISTAVAITYVKFIYDQVEDVRKKLGGLRVSPTTSQA